MKKKLIIFWTCFTVFMLALVREFWLVSPPPFPKWNCETHEINVKTGQARFRRYRLFVRIRNETKGTILSSLVNNPVDVADIKAWHMVNQFAPPSLRISPHYRFHGALSQVRSFETALQFAGVSPATQGELAAEILRIWQTTRGDSAADEIIMKLYEQKVSNQALHGTTGGRADASPGVP